MAFNDINDETIGQLISAFYAKARKDPDLGPIFSDHIGDDWDAHLKVIALFWSNVMLADGRYSGNPMSVHMKLSEVQPYHFKIWLDLFSQTARELFVDEIASAFVERAERIAQSLQIGMFERLGSL